MFGAGLHGRFRQVLVSSLLKSVHQFSDVHMFTDLSSSGHIFIV